MSVVRFFAKKIRKVKVSKRRLPVPLVDHRLLGLVEQASVRPTSIAKVKEKVLEFEPDLEFADELQKVILILHSKFLWRVDARNLFVGSLRAFQQVSPELAIQFGETNIGVIKDQRAIVTLINMHIDARNISRARTLLKRISRKNRGKLRRRIRGFDSSILNNFRNAYQETIGLKALIENDIPRVLLFADVDMNIIDGSSIWCASVAEVLAKSGFQVHLLLKKNIEREHLIARLRRFEEIMLVEPSQFREKKLEASSAAIAAEALDQLHGGYSKIVVRGLNACYLFSSKKAFHKRVCAYVTDFYGYDLETNKVKPKSDALAVFPEMIVNADSFAVQTPAIEAYLAKNFGVPQKMMVSLPPSLPDEFFELKKANASTALKIVYAGKVAPKWGVLELIDFAKTSKYEVHIIGDKIHNSKEVPGFLHMAREALRSDWIKWHKGLPRDEVLENVRTADLAWCYRDPLLEKNTLELSTKLLECLAVGTPPLVTRSETNEALLGADYPLMIDFLEQAPEAIESFLDSPISVPTAHQQQQLEKHKFSVLRETFTKNHIGHGLSKRKGKKIVLAGHALKFIHEFASYLVRQGHTVRIDEWTWRAPYSLERSKALAKWADYVFCEWALASAVWYTNHIDASTKLVVRIHQQEVIKQAQQFPPLMDMSRVKSVIFVADHMRELAQEKFNWKSHRLVTIPNFVNTNNFWHPKNQVASKQIAIVGVVPYLHKRIDRALNVVEKLRKEDREFRLIVKGKLPKDIPWMKTHEKELVLYEKQFERIRNEELLRDGVIFSEHGPLSQWYRDVGAILSPSNFETFHYSVAEGASSGALPVVWDWEGARQFYPEEWFVQSEDEAVERILKTLGTSFSSYDKTAVANKDYIEENFGLVTIFQKLEKELLEN